ncbi:hypothetical protein MMC19_006028 [Ptychographa xylographoides]|nr:hypothetical protein [Ptychographa xylographoides]
MYFATLLVVSGLAALSSAIPTPTELHARTCTTILPATYQVISESQQTATFPQNRFFVASQSATPGSNVDSLVHFTGIPDGSYGCTLGWSFTYEYNIPSAGDSQLNVYRLGTDISAQSTYSEYFPNGGKGSPPGTTLFGTTTLASGEAIVSSVINSGVCSPDMSFLFELASDTVAGDVSFQDAGDNSSGIGGFYMSFNC